MLSITCGRLHPRDPIFRRPDDVVAVLSANDARERKRAAELRTGDVLLGFGIVVSIEPMREAA